MRQLSSRSEVIDHVDHCYYKETWFASANSGGRRCSGCFALADLSGDAELKLNVLKVNLLSPLEAQKQFESPVH
jgi:hypothetical protein